MKPAGERTSPQLIREAAALLGANTLHRVKLPNFIGVGSGRCGTSHLFGLLASHPDFYLSPLKEVNFFGIKQAPFARDGWTLADYRFCFASQSEQKFIGEISPVYLAQTVSLRQILMHLGKIKILVTVRHPLARLISQFSFHRQLHKFDDLNSYVAAALTRYVPGYFRLDWQAPEKAIELSLYASGLQAAQELFGKDNVLVLVYEDLVSSEMNWKTSLSEFFSVDLLAAQAAVGLKNTGKTAAVGELSPELAGQLLAIFRPDGERLAALMDRDMPGLWSLR